MADPKITLLSDAHYELGEGPVWNEAEQALYWTDINAKVIHRYDWRTKAFSEWRLPDICGSLGFRKDGSGVVAFRTSLNLFDFKTGKVGKQLCDITEEHAHPQNRLNDGKIGPDGRYWVGSIDDRPVREPIAALYCIEADGSYRMVQDKLLGSNGLAWSPDGKTMYHSDTGVREAYAYDYDVKTGQATNRRLFYKFDETTGFPDGAAMDAEGYYWSAGVRGGRINRVSPAGKIERFVKTPMQFPTMPCFCGPDLTTIAVTSLDRGQGGDPEGGKIYLVEAGIKGMLGDRFAG